MKSKLKIKESIDLLCNMKLGTVWTEYHWRLVEQIRQELQNLIEKPTGYMNKGYWYEY